MLHLRQYILQGDLDGAYNVVDALCSAVDMSDGGISTPLMGLVEEEVHLVKNCIENSRCASMLGDAMSIARLQTCPSRGQSVPSLRHRPTLLLDSICSFHGA